MICLPTRLPTPTLTVHSMRMTRVFHKAKPTYC